MADGQAEGGHTFSGDQPPTVADVKNSFPSDPGITNVVSNVNVTSIANDDPNDHDYDDPYDTSGQSTALWPSVVPLS